MVSGSLVELECATITGRCKPCYGLDVHRTDTTTEIGTVR